MRHFALPAALGLAALLATPASAQEVVADPQVLEDAGRAADVMVGRAYVNPGTPIPPSAVIERLQALGYTNIHDFDVEWGEYEVEATAPNGEDVEIEIDPITGAILDIEEDFF